MIQLRVVRKSLAYLCVSQLSLPSQTEDPRLSGLNSRRLFSQSSKDSSPTRCQLIQFLVRVLTGQPEATFLPCPHITEEWEVGKTDRDREQGRLYQPPLSLLPRLQLYLNRLATSSCPRNMLKTLIPEAGILVTKTLTYK